ncbi:hypothetical protein [Rhizobium sp. ICMP 5592]|uniref:hypothetical protein n=1 Tax=Rhizobium sp. ICMP 5592 TaxID=2292445 RepID=UPI001294CD72|nr:hypothetical protein [Rhizobium sp. ICMP 5592]MQB42121.1 hypothetical protein [Rhizobium sp. ICMP 5592]
MEFEHAVSLGAWCQVDYQLRRHFKKRTMSCFESLVTPWPGLMEVLKDGPTELGVSVTENRYANAAECLKYGILLPHEFPKGPQEEVIFSRAAFINISDKLRHKHEKMLRTLSHCEGPVLFVRYGGNALPAGAWPYCNEPDPFDLRRVDELCTLLSRCFPMLNFRLLFAYEAETTKIMNEAVELDKRITIAPIDRRNDYSRWQGSDLLWDGLFTRETTKIVAYRGARRSAETKAPAPLPKSPEKAATQRVWRLPNFFRSER